MANLPVTDTTEIAQFAGGLYDIALDVTGMQGVLAGVNAQGLDPYLNAAYVAQFGNSSDTSVAQTLVTNLGLSGSEAATAEAYVTSLLNATAPDARGAAISSLLNQFSNMTGDVTFGAAATAWDALMAQATHYAETGTSGNLTLQSLATSQPSLSYTLTPGVDHIVVASSNATINGVGQGNGTPIPGVQVTFNPGDSISGGTTTGDTLNLSDATTGGTWNPTALAQSSVSDIQHVNLVSGDAVVFAPTNSFMGFTGLSDVNITSVSTPFHADDVVVGPSTSVVINDNADAGLGAAQYGAYGTVVQGGSTITVAESNGSGYGNFQHTILINGGTATTQVSVTQTESAPNGYQQGVVINDSFGTMQTIMVSGLDSTTWNAEVYIGPSGGYGGYGYGYYAVRQYNGGDLKITNATALTHLTLNNLANGAYATITGAVSLEQLTVENVSGGASINLYNLSGHAHTLNLALQNINGVVTVFDQLSVYATLNVTTVGDASLNYSIAPTLLVENLQNLNVSGTGMLTLAQPLQTPTDLSQVNITGSGGFSGDLSNIGNGSAVINAGQSSGAVTVWLDGSQQQVFFGGSGSTLVTLEGNTAQEVTAGTGANSEVVVDFALNGALSAQTATHVTGFEILGVTGAIGAGAQIIDVANFTGDAFHVLDVQSGAASGSLAFTQVQAGTALQVDSGDTQALVYQTNDGSGPNDSLTVTLGQAGAAGGAQTAALTLEDAMALQGIGNVTFSTLGLSGYSQTLGQLTDVGLTNLVLQGQQSTQITTLNDSVATLSVIDNAPGSSAIHTLNDGNLSNANFAQNGGGLLVVGDNSFAGNALVQLTLTGNVALTMSQDAASTGVTVDATQDNQNVTIDLLNGAGNGATDVLTLGNGNNQLTDASHLGQVDITVGTGSNLISLTGSGESASITLGMHGVGASDHIAIGASGYGSNQALVTVSGYNPGQDHLQFLADSSAGTLVQSITATEAAAFATAHGLDLTQLATWVNGALASNGFDLASHGVVTFQTGGNTYLLEQAGATGSAFGAGDTLIGLSGLLTITHL